MAATSINYTLIQSTIAGPPAQYQVQATCTGSVNIDQSVFVYRRSDDQYDHIATVVDVATYPTSTNPSFAYYRLNTVTKATTNSAEAVDFAATIKSRLTSLAKEYDLVAATFVPGTYPITVP